MERKDAISVWLVSDLFVPCDFRRTCAVSVGSHSSNRRKSAHSVPLMRCFWSAFLAENVCVVILGQSSRRSKSKSRRFVTNNLMSAAGIGFGGSLVTVPAVFVLTDWVRAWPSRVEAATLEVCEVGRDMVLEQRAA